jgi:hypothetical protein
VRIIRQEIDMTATQAHGTTIQPTPFTHQTARPSGRRTLVSSIGAVAAGSVALLAYGAAAVAVHGPMQAGDPGADHAVPITAASFAIGVLFSGALGIVLAVALARWASRPARTFGRVAISLTVVSLAAPLAASHTDESTRLLLAGGHVVAALVVIPLIVRSLRTTLA